MTFGSSGKGTELDNSIPEVQEREGKGKNPFPKFRNGKGMKKSFPKFGNGKGIKKSISKFGNRKGMKFPKFGNGREEAFIPGNGREREFTLTPWLRLCFRKYAFLFGGCSL